MGVDGDLYNVVLLLHILAVVVGFGGVILNGVYAARAKAVGGSEGLAVAEANLHVSLSWAEKAIYAVPVLGIAHVLMSEDVWSFEQLWITLSIVLYIIGIGVAHGVLYKGVKRLNGLNREVNDAGQRAGASPQGAEIAAIEKRLAAAGGSLNLLVVVIIALMIWKPGF